LRNWEGKRGSSAEEISDISDQISGGRRSATGDQEARKSLCRGRLDRVGAGAGHREKREEEADDRGLHRREEGFIAQKTCDGKPYLTSQTPFG
jgi:hypothetical protein